MLETSFKERSYAGETDLQPICALLNAFDAKFKLDDNYSLDDLRSEFTDPKIDIANDLRLWENEQGQLIGYGQLWRHDNIDGKYRGFLYFRVRPDYLENTELSDRITAWGEQRLRIAGASSSLPLTMRGFAREDETWTQQVLERNGFQPIRYSFKMRRPLSEPIPEPEFPAGYTLATINKSDKEQVRKWVEAFNWSFIDHWEHHPLTIEEALHHREEPNHREDLDLVAIAPDGSYAGFAFCRIDPDYNQRNNTSEGWVGLLGTTRDHRKIGLGKALLLAGLRKLKENGVADGCLGVDGLNPSGAVKLYESVGYRVYKQSRTYGKDL